MRINSRSTAKLGVKQSFPFSSPGRGLEKLSSGYCINRGSDGAAVLISQKSRAESGGLPQLIRSSGARPVVRAG